jgi:hypothetical protein
MAVVVEKSVTGVATGVDPTIAESVRSLMA